MSHIIGRSPRALGATLAALLAAAAITGTSGVARAQDDGDPGIKFEIGAAAGVHLFAKDLELGVADDPSLPSPKSPAALFGLRLGLVLHPMFAVEAEGMMIPGSDNQFDWRLYILTWRAHLRFNIAPGKIAGGKVTPFVVVGAGALSVVSTEGTAYNEIKKDTDPMYYGGAGVKVALTPIVHLRFDARALAVPNTSSKGFSPDFEFMGGLGFTLGAQAPPPPPPPPPVIKDTDGDGLPDDADRCPTEAGPRATGGCPIKDRDKDGVVDSKDKCPDEPGPVERDGCPEKDTDKDGIVDEKDKCPTEAEDKDGFEDDDGCPDPDNDKDGILDAQDKCPNEPETRNGYQDDDGCPDEVPVAVKKFTGVMKGINFRRNSADIKASSFPLLKEAVKVFRDYPALRVEISGHTSTDGRREFNMRLSQKRADSVRAFLISAGIEENRIGTIGYGPDKPIEDNATKAGQEKNRRIEFRLLAPDEKIQVAPVLPDEPEKAPKGKGKGKAKAAAAAPASDAATKPKAAGKTAAPDGDPTAPAKGAKKKAPAPAADKK